MDNRTKLLLFIGINENILVTFVSDNAISIMAPETSLSKNIKERVQNEQSKPL